MEIDARKVGELSANMLDMLESDLGERDCDSKIGLVHIAVEVECEDEDGESWTEVYIQCNERRGWVKQAFLHRLADFSDRTPIEIDLDDDDID